MDTPQQSENENSETGTPILSTPDLAIDQIDDFEAIDISSTSDSEDSDVDTAVGFGGESSRSEIVEKIVEETMRSISVDNINLENLIVVENGNAAIPPEDEVPLTRRRKPFFWWNPPNDLRRLYRGSLLWNLCVAQILMMLLRISIVATVLVALLGGTYGWAAYKATAVILVVVLPIGAYSLVEPFMPFGALTTGAIVCVFLDLLMIPVAVFASAYMPSSIWVNTSMTFVTLGFLVGYVVCIGRFENKLKVAMNRKSTTVEISQDANNLEVGINMSDKGSIEMETVKDFTNNTQLEVISTGTAAM